MDCSPPGSSERGIFQARTLERLLRPASRIFPTPGWSLPLPPRLHWLAASLPLVPPRGDGSSGGESRWVLSGPCDPMDYFTGVGRCSLLQGIFPNWRWNPGLPHCKWTLYRLSPQGSPVVVVVVKWFMELSHHIRDFSYSISDFHIPHFLGKASEAYICMHLSLVISWLLNNSPKIWYQIYLLQTYAHSRSFNNPKKNFCICKSQSKRSFTALN